MIIALLLAATHPGKLPDPTKDYAAYVKYTDGQFVCDDRPYTKGCGNELSVRRHRHHCYKGNR